MYKINFEIQYIVFEGHQERIKWNAHTVIMLSPK